jgi:UDP-3-O-acyl-N-acetylglucosamine deacetylase
MDNLKKALRSVSVKPEHFSWTSLNEAAGHKLLDVIVDLALVGYRLPN